MHKADPCEISQKTRQNSQNIMKSLVEFGSLVYARDISLGDLYPRNVILTGYWHETTRTVFIDFGDVRFDQSDTSEMATKWFPGMYISPLLQWHEARSRTYGFEDWIDWDWQSWLEAEFEHTAVTIKPEMQEKFLPAFLLSRSNSPPPLF